MIPVQFDYKTPATLDESELIYDWNSVEKVARLSPKRRIQFLDETLRDGIQSPSVVDPSIDDKLRLVAGASRRDRAMGILALAIWHFANIEERWSREPATTSSINRDHLAG